MSIRRASSRPRFSARLYGQSSTEGRADEIHRSTMWEATIEEKLAWMEQMTSKETAEAMPHYVGTAWFNVRRSALLLLR